jgi:hypothetical protein
MRYQVTEENLLSGTTAVVYETNNEVQAHIEAAAYRASHRPSAGFDSDHIYRVVDTETSKECYF